MIDINGPRLWHVAQQKNATWGENTVKGTMATKVEVLTED